MKPENPVDVPAQYRAAGFSGQFHIGVKIQPDMVDYWVGAVPIRLPHKDGAWLAVTVIPERLTVTMVRQDQAATADRWESSSWYSQAVRG